MTVKNIFSILLFLWASSCSIPPQKEAMVTGQLLDGKGEKLIFSELDTKSVVRLDSILLDEPGSFHFKVKTPEPGFFLLGAPSGKSLVMLLKPGETAKITGSFNEFPSHIHIAGSEDNALLDSFFRFTRKNEEAVDSLEMLMVEYQDSSGFYELTQKADTLIKNILARQRSFELDFVNDNPESLASLIVLYYAFGIHPVLNPEQDFSCFKKVDSALNAKYPGNKHTKYHHQKMEAYKQVQKK